MFKHILLPTDGSKLSGRAIQTGIRFAGKIKARVTALHVVPEFRPFADEGFAPMSAVLKKRLDNEARLRASKMLASVSSLARSRRVRCATLTVASDLPYEKIIETARKKKCDLIMMASHGRRGLSSLLLGSETSKVLLHSKIPVLVVR